MRMSAVPTLSRTCSFLCLLLAAMPSSKAEPPRPLVAETDQTPPRKPRLAIISTPELRAPADLLTVALSSEPTILLLERDEVGRVLRERGLAAGGLTTPNYAQLGKLLGAEGLVLLDTAKAGSNQVLTVRIVAAGPGVIVGAWYEKNPPDDVRRWADQVAGKVRVLAPKLNVPAGQAIPVSVLNLRSGLPTRKARDLERELTWLLIHRLASEPRLFVLERVQMERLAFEKAFASGPHSAFWTSCCVIDGEITEHPGEALSVKLRLELPGQTPQTVQASGTAKDLRQLAEALGAEVARQLGQDSLATAWKPTQEGRRFGAEAHSAFDAGLFDQALAAAEASQVLGFDAEELRLLLLKLHVLKTFKANDRPVIKAVPAEDVDLDSALSALDLYTALLKDHVPVRRGARGRATYELGPSALWNGSRVIRWYRENGLYARRRDDLELLRMKIRGAAQVLLALGSTNASCEFYCVMACYAPYWYDEPAQVLKAYDRVLASPLGDNAYAIAWVRHHLTEYRDKPNLFGQQDLDQRIPWLIDWNGTGEVGLKDLWRGFVQRRLQSPVLNDRLDGWLLAFYSADAPHRSMEVTEAAKADVWTNRATMLQDTVTFAITTQLIRGLPVGEDFRFQLLNYYLAEGRSPDYFFFAACFDPGFTNRAHAVALNQSMKTFERRVWPAGSVPKAEYSDFHSFQERLVSALPDLREQPSNGFQVTLSWPPVKAAPATSLRAYWPRQVLYAGGALWVSGDDTLKEGFQTTFTRVELPTFRTTVLKAPFSIPRPVGGAMNDFNHAFAVGGEWLFWVHDGRLARCRIATGQWDQTEVPSARFPLLKLEGGQLYYAFPSEPHQWAYHPEVSGILRISPDTMKVDTLASSRRKPAAGRLDDVPAYFVYDLFSGPGNHLYASILSHPDNRPLGELYCYSETEREWSPAHTEAAYNFVPYRVAPFNGGNVVQPISWPIDRAFILYQDGTLEFLFPDPYGRRKSLPSRGPRPSRLWVHAPWNPVVATADGSALWVLGPRQETEVAPLNLYLFTKGASQPVRLPLCFPSANTDSYPATDSGPLQLVGVPEGLVIAGTGDTAFWFLPRQALDSAHSTYRPGR
jgi:hypothetical protein